LFSNGDAHLKNFSILETNFGDYRLSPAYDLLNSRIHVSDQDFALENGLLPRNLTKGKMASQFALLAELAHIPNKTFQDTLLKMTTRSAQVEKLIQASFLNDTTKRNYLQAYQTRLKQLIKS
jgi:serine/threonine-protein kinase HipA